MDGDGAQVGSAPGTVGGWANTAVLMVVAAAIRTPINVFFTVNLPFEG